MLFLQLAVMLILLGLFLYLLVKSAIVSLNGMLALYRGSLFIQVQYIFWDSLRELNNC